VSTIIDVLFSYESDNYKIIPASVPLFWKSVIYYSQNYVGIIGSSLAKKKEFYIALKICIDAVVTEKFFNFKHAKYSNFDRLSYRLWQTESHAYVH